MKSGIRNFTKEFSFIKLQLGRISRLDKNLVGSNDWVRSSIGELEILCSKIMDSHENVSLTSMTIAIEAILSVFIREQTEDKELVRKKSRKTDQLKFSSLSLRQQKIETFAKKLISVRGSDPQLDSICNFIHLCRWGSKNVPISSSKRTATLLSIESELQKKEILYLVAKWVKKIGLYKRKSIENMIFSINAAYGNWNCYSIGGFPKSSRPLFSSMKNWVPNS